MGLYGLAGLLLQPDGVRNQDLRRRPLERAARAGESPLVEKVLAPAGDREYHGAREILWEAGWTTTQG